MTWAAFFLLGAYHGVNPGMGWLFAVALGMQERSRAAVWRTLVPLSLGHAAAVGVVIALALLVGTVIPINIVKWVVAAILVGLGLYKLVRPRHPRYGGMRVTLRQLGVWSFLMATAHGAGLMVLPVLLQAEAPSVMQGVATTSVAGPQIANVSHAAMVGGGAVMGYSGLLATLVHTAGYLLVTGLVAWVVYEKLGVLFLRRAWLNMDLIWAAALLVTGVATLLV